jgi:hypothetical protein
MAVEGLGKMKAREEHDGLQKETASLNRRMQENDPLMRSAGADGIIHHVQCQHLGMKFPVVVFPDKINDNYYQYFPSAI